MKTYIFVSKNSSWTIILNAESEEEAQSDLEEKLGNWNDFRLDEVEDDE